MISSDTISKCATAIGANSVTISTAQFGNQCIVVQQPQWHEDCHSITRIMNSMHYNETQGFIRTPIAMHEECHSITRIMNSMHYNETQGFIRTPIAMVRRLSQYHTYHE